jgi:hypothetical protein
MPYTHFRYIAYEVPTATQDTAIVPAADAPVESGFAAGNACAAVARLPVPANIPNDANVRLHRLAAVIDRAAARLNAMGGDNNNTLKIFVAPEFYFRPPSSNGATYFSDTYPQADMFQIWGAFDLMFQHADFQHWLFVPGTVLWNNSDDEMFAGAPKYFNSLMHIRGGGRLRPAQRIEKKLPADNDGIINPFATPGLDPDLKPFYEAWRELKQRVISVDGTELGLEVCLDHSSGASCRVLKTALSKWQNEQAGKSISLHILTAGGMPIQEKSVAARVNGYILRNDGFAIAPRIELKRVNGYSWGIFNVSPSNLWGTAALSASVAGADVTVIPPGDERIVIAPLDNGGAAKAGQWFFFTQRILIYPAQALP